MLKKKDEFGMKLKHNINTREYETMKKNNIQGLLELEVHKGLNEVSLYYETKDLMTLNHYLQRPLYEDDFKQLINRILNVFIEVEKNYLNIEHLFLDFNYIYFYNDQIYFAYLPHDEYHQEINCKSFFMNLIQYCHFYSGVQDDLIHEYLDLIQSKYHFNYHDLLSFVQIESKEETENLDFTTVLLNPPKYSYLIRISNEEKIILDHYPFYIGSKADNDYMIKDNRAVSRKYIMIEEGNLISDLGSTNATYINEQRLNPWEKFELTEGKIILGNEEFEFHKE